MEELQNRINRVASNQAGPYLNTKRKVMKIIKNSVVSEEGKAIISGQMIENAYIFVYLGAMFTDNYNDSKCFVRRLAIARNAMILLVNIWKVKAISMPTKQRLLKSQSLSPDYNTKFKPWLDPG